MSTTENTPLFQRPLWVTVFALTAAIAWGWAFPIVKIGFSAFGITPEMTGSKMLYAGIRFASAGLIVLTIARRSGHSFRVRAKSDWWFILAFALMNTTLHYFFFYIGMSHSMGSRAAILNSMSTFLVVLLACLCFKSDRMTLRKLLGCVIGFEVIRAACAVMDGMATFAEGGINDDYLEEIRKGDCF